MSVCSSVCSPDEGSTRHGRGQPPGPRGAGPGRVEREGAWWGEAKVRKRSLVYMFLRYSIYARSAASLPAGSCGYGSGRPWERVTAFVIAQAHPHAGTEPAPLPLPLSVAGYATLHARNVRFMPFQCIAVHSRGGQDRCVGWPRLGSRMQRLASVLADKTSMHSDCSGATHAPNLVRIDWCGPQRSARRTSVARARTTHQSRCRHRPFAPWPR